MRGHEEASGTKYVPKELMEFWAQKDPVTNFQQFLIDQKVLDEHMQQEIRQSIMQEINQGLEIAYAEDLPAGDTPLELQDVYAPESNHVHAEVTTAEDMRLLTP